MLLKLTEISQFSFHDHCAFLVIVQEDVVGFDILFAFSISQSFLEEVRRRSLLSPVWIVPFVCSDLNAERILWAMVLIFCLDMGALVADLSASSCKCSNTKQGGSSA